LDPRPGTQFRLQTTIEYYRNFDIWFKGHLRPFKLVPFDRLHGYGFLFAFHSNYGRIFSRLKYRTSQNG